MELPGLASWLAIAALVGLAAAVAAWRRSRAALDEVARGLRRLSEGDLAAPLDAARGAAHPKAFEEFDRALSSLRRAQGDAQADLARERARLQILAERIPDALIMTNLRGEILFVNEAALPLLGGTPEEVRPGRGLLEPKDPSAWRLRVQEMLKAHTAGGFIETSSGDGPPTTHATLVTMFNDPGTGDFGVLLLLRDATAQRSLDAVKEEFFQAAAHDLRAPLFAVQGYLRLLQRSMTPDERQQGWFEAVDQSCEKLTALVKDALDSARIESGRMRIVESSFDPRALLRRAARLFVPLAEERGVAVETGADEGVPGAIEADERLLERLVQNLVSNAIKFTPRGGLVRAWLSASGADHWELVVSDTGLGIPEAQRSAVFEKYRQLENGLPKSGFGLGLNICAKIVKLHKGLIWVEPGVPSGSRFVVRLPLSQRVKEVVQ